MRSGVVAKAGKRAIVKLAHGSWRFLYHPVRSFKNFVEGDEISHDPFRSQIISQLTTRWPGIESDPAVSEKACVTLVAEAMGISELEPLKNFVKDLKSSQLPEHIRNGIASLKKAAGSDDTGLLSHNQLGGLFLYLLVRAAKPTSIVETGVANGESSAHILQALEHNGQGKLYSIDLPPQLGAGEGREYFVPKDSGVGWLVPQGLRPRWELTLGPAQLHLPEVLKRLGTIDIFYHDSLHTYRHMAWEYETAWPHLSRSGLLLSDDVNSAWADFAKSQNRPFVTYFYLAATRKV